MITTEDKQAAGEGPLDPDAPPSFDSSGDVLLNLRSGWLADSETAPKPRKKLLAFLGPALGEPLLNTPVKKESAGSVKATMRRIRFALLSRSRRARKERDAGQLAITLFATVMVMMILGALSYTTVLNYIMDAAKR